MSTPPPPPPDNPLAPPNERDGEAGSAADGAVAVTRRARDASTGDGAVHVEHRVRTAVTQDGFEVPAPMAQVRSDVDRISAFFHSIHSRYVWAGILLLLATAATGTIIAATTPMRDWYMHAAMYFVVFVFIMFYLRAHQRHRRLARALYALVAAALIGFFIWVLLDLVAPRLEVVEGPITGADGQVVIGPILGHRPAASALHVPIAMLAAVGVWLLFHWLVVTRYHREDGTEVL